MLLLGVLALCGDIASIVLAIMSVITAIVTAIMLYKQYQLQQKQHDLEREKLKVQEMEHQPSFQITRNEDNLTISNIGCHLSAPIKTAITSMIIVKSSKYINEEWGSYVYCYPVLYYAKKGYGTTNIYGDLVIHLYDAKDYDTLKNKVQDIYKGFLNPHKHEPMTYIGSVTISDLIEINYVDMYKKEHTVYYLDTQIVSKETFDRLIEISQQVPMGVYDVNNVKVDNIIYMTYATNYKLDV